MVTLTMMKYETLLSNVNPMLLLQEQVHILDKFSGIYSEILQTKLEPILLLIWRIIVGLSQENSIPAHLHMLT